MRLTGDGRPIEGQCRFDFSVSENERASIRWYLEDYLQYPVDPAPKVAESVERMMSAIGARLFASLFAPASGGAAVWQAARTRLPKLRVSVETDLDGAAVIPWELMRDGDGRFVTLSSREFVRTVRSGMQEDYAPETGDSAVRILLVICRPRAGGDVPFRSVAGRILAALQPAKNTRAAITVLRPPTFEQLSRVLRQAALEKKAYQVVHFDGHGTYADVSGSNAIATQSLVEPGKRGFLLFENPEAADNAHYVDGKSLGDLLTETEARVLVLNACRSTYAEPSPTPQAEAGPDARKAQAFGSLAHEVLSAGVPGVVAMRYTIYVVTAAQYMADLYESVSRGATLGEAASFARKQLAANRLRQIAFEPVPFQDWSVPVVYERSSIRLLENAGTGAASAVRIDAKQGMAPAGSFQMRLPARPEAGFFGRDETILALDRAFDSHAVVLLHAFAGSGKTAAVAEFARWYKATGGIDGPVFFTSFSTHLPLLRALDHFSDAFREELQQEGIQWLAIPDEQRPEKALDFLENHSGLWIWDNVEPVAGFPGGSESAWTEAEQDELRDFLQRAASTKLKVLMTSRRDEEGWLGDIPSRVKLPPLAFQETVQLTRALAERRARRITEVEDWRPLLAFTQGNPLTIAMLVGQALRGGVRTREEVEAFLAKLRSGAEQIRDDMEQGRSKSLAASLGYGFEDAFDEEERLRLSVLHLFEGFVSVFDLRQMGHATNLGTFEGLGKLTDKSARALLDRAAEIGLLSDQGNGFYAMHPMLPWFLKERFDSYAADNRDAVIRAFTSMEAILSVQLENQYDQGQFASSANLLAAEEANLRRALEYAKHYDWKLLVSGICGGLKRLLYFFGRQAEWARMLADIVPMFFDPATEGPLPGSEAQWSVMMDHRVRLATELGQWLEAQRLQKICVEWDSNRAAGPLSKPKDARSEEDRQAIRFLAKSYELWADILRELQSQECVAAYVNAIKLGQEPGESPLAATFGLAQAYLTVEKIKDLANARQCYVLILAHPDATEHDRARCMVQLGTIELIEVQEAGAGSVATDKLERALQFFAQAGARFPKTDLRSIAGLENQTALVLRELKRVPEAVEHLESAAILYERIGEARQARSVKANLARVLFECGRIEESEAYATAVFSACAAAGDAESDAAGIAGLVLFEIFNKQQESAADAP